MSFCDFVIKFDPDKDTDEDVAKKILYSIIVKPLKAKKPRVIFISGNSGEGKSYGALKLQEALCETMGLSLIDYVNDINVYKPQEYSIKLDRLLFNKNLKKVNIFCIHEARELVKAKLWYSFLNQVVSDVNAMSRSVKRICTIIISQFIRDISTDVRYTIDYYIKASRPIHRRTRFYIYAMWKDDRDLEKPKLKKRKLTGYKVYPNGKYRRFSPQYIELSLPSKEIIESFEKNDTEAKASIIRKKLEKLTKEMENDLAESTDKIQSMVDFYSENQESLSNIGRMRNRKFTISQKFKDMHDLTHTEAKEFEKRLSNKLKDIGMEEKENEPDRL